MSLKITRYPPPTALRRCARRGAAGSPAARSRGSHGWEHTRPWRRRRRPRQLRLGGGEHEIEFRIARANQPQSLEARTAVRKMAQRVDMMGPAAQDVVETVEMVIEIQAVKLAIDINA